MATKWSSLERKVKKKYGRVKDNELKQIVIEVFREPWGPRYTKTPVNHPTIQDLTPTVLRKLLEVEDDGS